MSRRRKSVISRRFVLFILIFVVIVIAGSFLITRKPANNQKSADSGNQGQANSGEKANTETNSEEEFENALGQMQTQISEAEKSETTTQEQTTTKQEVDKEETTKAETTETKTTKKTNTNTPVKGGRLPVANSNSIALCKQAQTAHEKNIYLTFDDGPSPNITPQILSILEEYNVPATFFVLGSRVELYPELVRQEYEAGHYIANHGYSHTYPSIYSSVQSVLDEYTTTESAIQDALGLPEFHSYLFRFPGGSSGGPYNDLKAKAKSTLEGMGIASTNWNCLNGDAEGGKRSKEQLINRLYETAEGWTSLVVLMHDANDKQSTADALPEIIEHYLAEGYTFKNYYDIFQ